MIVAVMTCSSNRGGSPRGSGDQVPAVELATKEKDGRGGQGGRREFAEQYGQYLGDARPVGVQAVGQTWRTKKRHCVGLVGNHRSLRGKREAERKWEQL